MYLQFSFVNSDMLARFCLYCDHKRVSRSNHRVFNHNSAQQVGTFIQDVHILQIMKVKNRSASKKGLLVTQLRYI